MDISNGVSSYHVTSLSLIVALVALIVGVWLVFRSNWQDHSEFIKTDPDERARRTQQLRVGTFGQLYPALLERGLTLLDRWFGHVFSARALNACTVLAICYAYVFFYIAYGLGAPGGLGEGWIWAPAHDTSTRLIIAFFFPLFPPLIYFLSRWLSRIFVTCERRLKLVLRRHHRLSAIRFEMRYRALLAVIVIFFVLYLYIAFENDEFDVASLIINSSVVFLVPVIGAFAGEYTARRVANTWLKSPLSAFAGAGVGALTIAFAFAFTVVLADTLTGALASIVALVSAVAGLGVGAVAVVGVGTFVGFFFGATAIASLGFGTDFDTVAVGLAAAVAVAIAIGIAQAVRGKRLHSWSGLVAGSIGCVLSLALLPISEDETVKVLISLFFAVAIANGLWDFGSWWVSRILGEHLLTTLKNQLQGVRQGWTIFWHIALDSFLAILFLLSLAWFLGFALEFYHNFARWLDGGVRALPELVSDIRSAAADPFGQGLWLTAMLLSTLIPTLLHSTITIASMLTSFSPLTAYRTTLANNLEALHLQDEKTQALTLQRTGHYLVNVRPLIWLAASGLLLALLTGLSILTTMIHNGGFSDYVKIAALNGVAFSDWLFGY